MLTTRERDGIGEILFQEVSLLEPELAEVLTSMMLEMEDEDILTLIGDDTGNALQAQVQLSLDELEQRLSLASHDGQVVESEDEWILTPPSRTSNRSTWSPSAESTSQIAAVIADSEDIEDQGPTESARVPTNSEATKEVAGKNSTQSHHGATVYVETTRVPAELDTMKESVASSAALQTQETRMEADQDYRSCSSLASTSTASYVLGAKPETAGPAGPTSQKKGGKKVAKTPRAPKHDAADHSHPLVETEEPASMQPMEAVRQAEPAPRAQRPTQTTWRPARRTTRPANTGARAEEVDDAFEHGAVGGFLCGVLLTICCMFIFL